MKSLILIRHGKPACGSSIFYGRTDVELSPEGKEQSEKLVDILSKRSFKKVFSSPLRRCLYPAKLLSEKAGIPLEIREEIMELDFGKWSGKSWEELSKKEEFSKFYTDENFRPPDGESLREMKERIKSFINYFLKNEEDGEFVCFTHSGVIRNFFILLFNLPINHYFTPKIDYLHLCQFDFYPDGLFVLSAWNCSLLED
ncbi:MAG: histidine phosphatase family protein [Thermodesulfobacteria bacterium]|nr:histidine phosphatase family protein [Thermodesulfobacteriota bacterium]